MAAMVLGAEGVQIGSRFVATPEASSHDHFKQAVISAAEGDTMLSIKRLTPVRLLHNDFARSIQEAEKSGATNDVLTELLGRARAKLGMFEGDLEQGELEIGQVSAMIREIVPAGVIVEQIMQEFELLRQQPLAFSGPATPVTL